MSENIKSRTYFLSLWAETATVRYGQRLQHYNNRVSYCKMSISYHKIYNNNEYRNTDPGTTEYMIASQSLK